MGVSGSKQMTKASHFQIPAWYLKLLSRFILDFIYLFIFVSFWTFSMYYFMYRIHMVNKNLKAFSIWKASSQSLVGLS